MGSLTNFTIEKRASQGILVDFLEQMAMRNNLKECMLKTHNLVSKIQKARKN
jgi:hypothetical protein